MIQLKKGKRKKKSGGKKKRRGGKKDEIYFFFGIFFPVHLESNEKLEKEKISDVLLHSLVYLKKKKKNHRERKL